MIKHLNISISGRVQGVFFRASAREEAEKLGLSGFVQNETDGSVYIEVEGKSEALDTFVSWCSQGPDFAQVDKVVVKDGKLQNFDGFYIKRTEGY